MKHATAGIDHAYLAGVAVRTANAKSHELYEVELNLQSWFQDKVGIRVDRTGRIIVFMSFPPFLVAIYYSSCSNDEGNGYMNRVKWSNICFKEKSSISPCQAGIYI